MHDCSANESSHSQVALDVGVDWMSSFGRTRFFTLRDGPASQAPLVAGLQLIL